MGARCFASIQNGQLADTRTKMPLHKSPVHLNSPPGIVTILLHVVLLSDTLFHPLDARPPSSVNSHYHSFAPPHLIGLDSRRTFCALAYLNSAPRKLPKLLWKFPTEATFHPFTDQLPYPEMDLWTCCLHESLDRETCFDTRWAWFKSRTVRARSRLMVEIDRGKKARLVRNVCYELNLFLISNALI